MNIILILGTIGLIFYIIDVILQPEKHIIGLVLFAIVFSIFGAFYETTGAKADYNKRKKG